MNLVGKIFFDPFLLHQKRVKWQRYCLTIFNLTIFFYFNNLPCGRYAPMVRTSKWIWRARSGTAVKIVLVRIISTIVVSIAKPIRFHTNCRIFTLHMTLRAGHILISTSYFRLIRSTVVLAIVDAITFLTFRDTSEIFASEFAGSAIFVFAI